MDDDIDAALVEVRADTGAFKRDVAVLRTTLETGLGDGADRAGKAIETALLRAVRSGKLGFDDLKSVALSVLAEIAAAAVKSGLDTLTGESGGGSGGSTSLAGVLAGLLGSPGRATGGPVSPGRAYVVGERGPEVFVPTSSGRVETGTSGGGAREVKVAITVNAAAGSSPGVLAQSSRQVARAVKAALE